MQTQSRTISRYVTGFAPDAPLVEWIDAGDAVTLLTRDASGDQFIEGFDVSRVVTDELFPITGPVGVRGVGAGDVIGVHVQAIEPAPTGHTWTRQGLGFASPVGYHVRELSSRNPIIDWGSRAPIVVTPRLHIGALGVVPQADIAPRSLGVHGGNLDTARLGTGSTLWLRAQVDGAGVFAGDVHASIGDAEVCGTGIEVAASVTLSITAEKRFVPRLPTLRAADGSFWLIADGDGFDDAMAAAVRECTRLLAAGWGMSEADAYLAVGLLLKVEVCQVVNPRRSLAVSLSGGADVCLGPEPYQP